MKISGRLGERMVVDIGRRVVLSRFGCNSGIESRLDECFLATRGAGKTLPGAHLRDLHREIHDKRNGMQSGQQRLRF